VIAERASEPAVFGGEVGSGGPDITAEITEWLERRPQLRRPFVDNYRPRHRAEPDSD
jgi:hypothetical protein